MAEAEDMPVYADRAQHSMNAAAVQALVMLDM